MSFLTVFTPTYNRAYCLNKCYESLLRQTSKDFEWLIIDDGSIDNTRELVKEWQDEGKILIKYIYKKNGGMHSGYNLAYDNIFTELSVCVDSDDYLTDDAVELITNVWRSNKAPEYAGIVGLDITESGDIIGKPLPKMKAIKIYDYFYRYHGHGDKKMVYRPEVIRPYHSPEFSGERLFPTCYKYYNVDLNYDMLVLNKPLCIVEYMADGFTTNILSHYKKNLNGYIYYRKFILTYPNATLTHKYRFAIHYVAECMLNKEKRWFVNAPKRWIVLLAIFPGLVLYLYLRYRA